MAGNESPLLRRAAYFAVIFGGVATPFVVGAFDYTTPQAFMPGDPVRSNVMNERFDDLDAALDALEGGVVPVGGVIPFAGLTLPDGWLACDGSEVSRTELPTLFATIGTAHGSGDGATTFNVPDYRGRFLRGVDDGAGRDPDAATRTPANLNGNAGDLVGSVQDDALQAHRHGYRICGSPENNGNNSFIGDYDGSPCNDTNAPGINEPTELAGFGVPRLASETRVQNAGVQSIIRAGPRGG